MLSIFKLYCDLGICAQKTQISYIQFLSILHIFLPLFILLCFFFIPIMQISQFDVLYFYTSLLWIFPLCFSLYYFYRPVITCTNSSVVFSLLLNLKAFFLESNFQNFRNLNSRTLFLQLLITMMKPSIILLYFF